MARLLSIVLIFAFALVCRAQTPTSVLSAAAAHGWGSGNVSDRDLQIAQAYLLTALAGLSSSPSAILAAGAAWQALSDRQLQEADAYLLSQMQSGFVATNFLGTITVSAKGITNGLSTVANDGARFGPDTPGTQTSGIQEALNSIPVFTGMGTNVVGAEIHFGAGDFYCTNFITYSNTYVAGITLKGANYLVSRIIYAGAPAQTNAAPFFLMTGAANNGGGSFHPVVRDLTFASITNCTITLLRLTNCASERVEGCRFTRWEGWTNTTTGSGVSVGSGDTAGSTPGILGLQIGNSFDNSTILNDCLFDNLAGGVDLIGDHVYVRNCTFSTIGQRLGGFDGTLFDNTSVYSLGACIYRSTGLATYIYNIDMYASMLGIANDSASGIGEIYAYTVELEGTDNGWYAAFNPAATRVYVSSASSILGTSFLSGQGPAKINHAPYAATGVGIGFNSIPIVSTIYATYNSNTNALITRLTGVPQGGNFAGELTAPLPAIITNSSLQVVPTYNTNLVPVGVNPDADVRTNKYFQYFTTNNTPVVINALTNVDVTGTKFFDFYFVISNSSSPHAEGAIILPNNVHTNIAGSVQRVTNITYVRFSGIGGLWTNGFSQPQW